MYGDPENRVTWFEWIELTCHECIEVARGRVTNPVSTEVAKEVPAGVG